MDKAIRFLEEDQATFVGKAWVDVFDAGLSNVTNFIMECFSNDSKCSSSWPIARLLDVNSFAYVTIEQPGNKVFIAFCVALAHDNVDAKSDIWSFLRFSPIKKIERY